jgi:hypothetical protein
MAEFLSFLLGPSRREREALNLLAKIRNGRMLYTRHPEYPIVKMKIGSLLRQT